MKYHIPTPTEIEDEARKQGLSMREVVRRAGLTTPTFWEWKRGKQSITLSSLLKLLAALEA